MIYFSTLKTTLIQRGIISNSNWLVLMLVAAATAAVFFFTIMPGPLVSNLGLSPYAQLANPTGATGDNDNTHESGSLKHGEHDELFAMVPHTAATHVALGGDWSDPSSWAGGVPTTSAKVLIPENVTITYNVNSDVRIDWLRIDGELTFPPTLTTKLVIDTLVVDADGTLTIGTENNPVTGSVDIVIADNGDIDTTWDTLLQSRGVISHGTVNIHGKEKLVHGKVAADPMAGATSITLKDTPTGWQVGDIIVIAGTNYYGPDWYNRDWRDPEDEVRTITTISGKTVSFTDPLINNHDTPRADLKTSVANYSRTVTFRSENGASTAINHRGHVMFMHNDNIDVRYAAFDQLGRTDKSAPSLEAVMFNPITPSSNVRGRYSLHIHRTGATDLSAQPAIVLGNAVFNSPGWGYVHHDSYAILHNNASYDTFGAGFVAETGNEIGSWTNNIAIDARGLGWKEPKFMIGSDFDNGNDGAGFFFQGRNVKSRGNVAASVNHGFTFFHRGGERVTPTSPTSMLSMPYTVIDYPYSAYNGDEALVGASHVPIIGFNDNEAFAARAGFHVTKHSPIQGSDVHSVLKRFTAWNVIRGADLTYTSHYHLEDFDITGRLAVPGKSGGDAAIILSTNAADITVIAPTISDFTDGIRFNKSFTFNTVSPLVDSQYVVVNAQFSNITNANYDDYDAEYDQVLENETLPVQPFRVVLDKSTLIFNAAVGKIAPTGLKYDGVGVGPLPAGADHLHSGGYKEIAHTIKNEGYRKINDEYYVILPQHFTDRSTGEVHIFGLPVLLDDSVVPRLTNNDWLYGQGSLDTTPLDLDSQAPMAVGEREIARPDRVTTFSNLLNNDSDPEGDLLTLRGFSQPEHGIAYQVGDESIAYRPDFDYEGLDKIKYWVVDTNGKYSHAWIAISVTNGSTKPAGITPVTAELVIATDVNSPGAPIFNSTPEPETPTSTPPSSSRSSGGGGGGGGGNNSSSDPDPVTTQIGGNYTSESVSSIQPSDTNLSAPVTTQTPKTSLPATDLFKKNISFKQAAYNNTTDVRNLEQFLNDFEGESLTIDGTYSSADNEAIKRFQLKYKREILDVWNLTEATGYVGITTRLKMNFLLKGQTAVCPAFTEYNGGLSGVMSSAEIGKTQTILKDLAMYNGPINNIWDSATNKALITFQETFREVMLDPWNINKGTGYKYKTTNKFLNYFAGCDTGAVNLEGVGVYEGI